VRGAERRRRAGEILTPLQISAPGSPVPEETRARAARPTPCSSAPRVRPPRASSAGCAGRLDAWAGVRPAKFYPGMRSPLADPRRYRPRRHQRELRGMYPGARATSRRRGGRCRICAIGSGAASSATATAALPSGRHERGRHADRALRVRAGAPAQGARPRRQGHLRDEVQRGCRRRTASSTRRSGRPSHVSRSRVRGTSTWDDGRAAHHPLPQDHGRPRGQNQYGDILSDVAARSRAAWASRPRPTSVTAVGVLRVGARLRAGHRGPRHREPDGHACCPPP